MGEEEGREGEGKGKGKWKWKGGEEDEEAGKYYPIVI